MIRQYTFILCSLFFSCASAQSWCPPGATWTYNAWQFLAGFNRMSYIGDTLIDGYEAQIIDRYSANQYPIPPPDGGWTEPIIEYTAVAAITRYEDDVVYLRSASGWDTLYWFGAVPGDHWNLNYLNMGPDCAPVVVGDTGTTVFDGVPLRWVEIGGMPVYERIGWTWNMALMCPNIIGDGPTGLRCYEDDEISVQFSDTPCEIFVGIGELNHSSPLLYPNPGTDHFTLQLPPGLHQLTLFDAQGRQVQRQLLSEERPVISTASLPSGIYHIHIADHYGRFHGLRWVKE